MRQAALLFGKAGAVDRISDRILDILYEVPEHHLLTKSAPNVLNQSGLNQSRLG
jgi:hypothetical protein